MTPRLPHLESIFPGLAAADYSPRSEKSSVYNCVAYAAGDESRKWEGFREIGYYWPDCAKEGHSLDALISAFEQLGYVVCDSDALEADHEKVALYADQDGLWTTEENSMTNTIELLDVVALTADLPERGLYRGQVGTAVEPLAPDVFEVEFCDNDGRTYASLALRADQLMVLRYRPLQVA